ncbi:MAG: FAD-dependent oxidoreductase [Actinomycetota bacterium]
MTAHIAVVGAGLAGLTAANHLIDAGHRVTVFERTDAPGGRASTSDHQGYRFNRGPHALYRGGPAEDVLRRLGIDYTGHAPVQAVPRGLYHGTLHRLPGTPTNLARTTLLGARGKLTLASLMTRLGREAAGAAGQTVEDWIADRTEDRTLRALLHALVRLSNYANAPDQLDAGAALGQLHHAAGAGVWYLDGGWQGLVDGLTARARGRGATFERSAVTTVAELRPSFAGVVVAVGGPAATASLTGVSAPDLVTAAGPPAEAAVLELGITRVPDIRVILGIDQPLYASVHSPPTDLAPEGHAVVCLARYVCAGEEHDKDATRGELLSLAGRMGIDPGHIAAERYLHRMTVTHGLPLARRGGLTGRPDVNQAGDPRIAVAGDWVGPTGMLADAALASGWAAAATVSAACVAQPRLVG